MYIKDGRLIELHQLPLNQNACSVFDIYLARVKRVASSLNAAFVDINNDGWLDIFYSTYREGNFVIYNKEGDFRFDQQIKLPNREDFWAWPFERGNEFGGRGVPVFIKDSEHGKDLQKKNELPLH